MIESTKRLSELIFKSIRGELSPPETQELQEWLERSPDNRRLYEDMIQPSRIKQGLEQVYEATASRERVLERVRAAVGTTSLSEEVPAEASSFSIRRWLPYAAAILLLAGGAGLWWFKPKVDPAPRVVAAKQQDVSPGGTGAILTLADGSTVKLDSLENGEIASQGGSKVMIRNGYLAYQEEDARTQTAAGTARNMISTPRGRQFQLLLPDGTKVWLNAGSSLSYPVVFSGKERSVDITGEAYFEVAPDPQRPFKVKMGIDAEIEVLGTHFNVNAYPDEPQINTTLLEGSIRISAASEGKILKPGYQASMKNGEIRVKQVDVEEAMAWKNGLFIFADTDIETVMRQLSRWYDIEVVIEGTVKKRQLTGEVYRSYTLQQALSVLQATDLHFSINGRQLKVMP
ncbi:FecR domain-containing protein [Chitinophaga sp. MM2321]|uniref:FecR domain-containing protein n=1 Tax=Chitinophaga sp. MM2321 TaxID=3137178 RepID=UPI0032D57B77